ncbi:MAG TPA: hypothetical protein VKC56_02000, partial [Gallionellaceae bacterium]|nr:hypothetical protein [Gallionellaceae bacterium]
MSDVWTPPRAEVKDVGLSGNPDAPEIRQQHLSHEANIKALGTLYYLGFVIMTLGGIAKLLTGGGTGRLAAYNMGMGIAFIVLGLLYFWLGRGLRTLKPWSRIVA